MTLGLFVVLFAGLQFSLAKPDYRDFIPNGYVVPNPCLSPNVWNAVGHYNPDHHTRIKNKFGWDFIAQNKQWTLALCRMDSDRDGHTNGEELGDPNCEWMEGDTPKLLPQSHPGICEPVGSDHCMSEQAFTCDQKENSNGLKS